MNDERNLGEKTDDSGQQPRYEHYQFHEEQGNCFETHPVPLDTEEIRNSFQRKKQGRQSHWL